ncbi:hypothetical protein C8J57DRAFT_1735194 [Mycena rebaudengoi]|nr:hypothetical protein C8J57DRAFT_1735194 [Mycena rebaudengoi]
MALESADNDAFIRSHLYHSFVEDGVIPPKELGIPLKQVFREDWNSHFERATRQKYGPDGDLRAWSSENNDDEGLLKYMGDLSACKRDIILASRALLETEGVLVARAMEKLDDQGFQQTWTALEIEAKRRLVLEGMVRAATEVRQESRLIHCVPWAPRQRLCPCAALCRDPEADPVAMTAAQGGTAVPPCAEPLRRRRPQTLPPSRHAPRQICRTLALPQLLLESSSQFSFNQNFKVDYRGLASPPLKPDPALFDPL